MHRHRLKILLQLMMARLMIPLPMRMRDETCANRVDIPNMTTELAQMTKRSGDEDASRDDRTGKLSGVPREARVMGEDRVAESPHISTLGRLARKGAFSVASRRLLEFRR